VDTKGVSLRGFWLVTSLALPPTGLATGGQWHDRKPGSELFAIMKAHMNCPNQIRDLVVAGDSCRWSGCSMKQYIVLLIQTAQEKWIDSTGKEDRLISRGKAVTKVRTRDIRACFISNKVTVWENVSLHVSCQSDWAARHDRQGSNQSRLEDFEDSHCASLLSSSVS
jgi:hypothetical protein